MSSLIRTFRAMALLALLVAGLSSNAFAAKTYSDNGNGTVTDPTTGLTWMRCSMGQTWNGSTCIGTASIHTFYQAKALTCTVTFAGRSDWRLPNIRELTTIVDLSVYNSAIDQGAFPATPSSHFWSGSPYVGSSSSAWVVYFSHGNAYGIAYGGSVGDSSAVRLVRAGQSFGTFALTVGKSGPGTVSSRPTGIDCGAACSASFASGTSVTLTAAPAAGSTFTG